MQCFICVSVGSSRSNDSRGSVLTITARGKDILKMNDRTENDLEKYRNGTRLT